MIRQIHAEAHCVAWSPDRELLAVATYATRPDPKHNVIVFNFKTGKELYRLPGDAGCGFCGFTPDGKRLLTANGPDERRVQLWDAKTGKLDANFTPKTNYGPCAIAPDGKTVAAKGDKAITLFSLPDGKKLVETGDDNFLTGRVVFSPDGKTLLKAGVAGMLSCWDTVTLKRTLLVEMDSPEKVEKIVGAAWLPDGKSFLTLIDPARVVERNAATGKVLRNVKLVDTPPDLPFKDHPHTIGRGHGCALSPDGKLLAVIGTTRVGLFDVETLKNVEEFKGVGQGGLTECVIFSPDGKQFATGSGGSARSNNVYIWNVPRKK